MPPKNYYNSRCPRCDQPTRQTYGHGYCYDCDEDHFHCSCGQSYCTEDEWTACEDNYHYQVLDEIVRAIDSRHD